MGDPIRVLELRSVRGTGGGPEKTILLGASRTDARRFLVTVCYLRAKQDADFQIDRQARQLGIDYLEVVERHSFDPAIVRRLRSIVRERGIQIVHAHEYKTDLLAYLLGRFERVIPLSTVHGWSGNSLKERLYYRVDKWLLTKYPLVIAVSEPIRKTILAHGADPSRVRKVHNGIDHTYFRHDASVRERMRSDLAIPPDMHVVGAVGRLEGEKRFDLLLEATARLPPSIQPLVVIAGEGSERVKLTELANRLGLRDRLRLLGHRTDVREVHHVLDVYVQTSDTEGIPNAVLEAMALETPVVATAVGGTGELIDDGAQGRLVRAGDAADISRAIEAALRDRSETLAQVAEARARIEREFSFAARMEKIEAIYTELAHDNPLQTRRAGSSTGK